MKLLIFSTLVLILASLALALLRFKQGGDNMVRPLALRIALSILLFVLLFVGYKFNLITPHAANF